MCSCPTGDDWFVSKLYVWADGDTLPPCSMCKIPKHTYIVSVSTQ